VVNIALKDLSVAEIFPWLRIALVDELDSEDYGKPNYIGSRRAMEEKIIEMTWYSVRDWARNANFEILTDAEISPSLGALFPYIPNSAAIAGLNMNPRSNSSLRNAGIAVFEHVKNLSVSQVRNLKGLGPGTFDEIFEKLSIANIEYAIRFLCINPPLNHLGKTLPFYAQDHSPLVPVAPVLTSMSTPPPAITAPVLSLSGQIESAVSQSSMTERIFHSRVVVHKGETLDAIGGAFNLTRERVRQLEVKLRKTLSDILADSSEASAARELVLAKAAGIVRHEELRNNILILGEGVGGHGFYVLDVIVGLSPSIQEVNGLLYSPSKKVSVAKIILAIRQATHNGVLDEDSFWNLCVPLGIDPELALLVAAELGIVDNNLASPRRNMSEKLEDIFRKSGVPVSLTFISALLSEGEGGRYLSNVLAGNENFVRTSKFKWALREWGLEEYKGVKEAIATRLMLEEGLRLDALADELASAFEISPKSVRTYAHNWPFEVRGGSVFNAPGKTASSMRSLSETPNVWNLGGYACLAFTVTAEQLRGSGSSIPRSLATRLALELGHAQGSPNVSGGTTSISVSKGLSAVGSIRDLLGDFQVGDTGLLVFGSQIEVLKAPSDRVAQFKFLISRALGMELTSNLEELNAAISNLLFLGPDSPIAQSFSALRARKEPELLEFLETLFGNNIAFELEKNFGDKPRFTIRTVRKLGL